MNGDLRKRAVAMPFDVERRFSYDRRSTSKEVWCLHLPCSGRHKSKLNVKRQSPDLQGTGFVIPSSSNTIQMEKATAQAASSGLGSAIKRVSAPSFLNGATKVVDCLLDGLAMRDNLDVMSPGYETKHLWKGHFCTKLLQFCNEQTTLWSSRTAQLWAESLSV